MPGGPAALAIATGAVLFPVSLWVQGDETVGCIHPQVLPPTDGDKASRVATTTQSVVSVFETAIAEGATLVRVGTAIFGARSSA